MGQIRILGISLYDCAVKEAIRRTWKYMDNGAMNTVSYISAKMLVDAGNQPELKQYIEELDLTIPGDPDILKAAGITNKNRYHEITSFAYLEELLKRIVRSGKRVVLISDTSERTDTLGNALNDLNSALEFYEKISMEEIADEDYLVNELNDIAPDIIISRLPVQKLQLLLSGNRNKINASLWLSLLYEGNLGRKRTESRFSHIKSLINRKIFRRRVNQYNNSDEAGEK